MTYQRKLDTSELQKDWYSNGWYSEPQCIVTGFKIISTEIAQKMLKISKNCEKNKIGKNVLKNAKNV